MMTGVKRTTVLLPEELHERLRQEAFRQRISMAELIRSRLARTTGRRSRRAGSSDPLTKVEGLVRDGKLSARIDKAIYGN
jgi:hypothetical protein